MNKVVEFGHKDPIYRSCEGIDVQFIIQATKSLVEEGRSHGCKKCGVGGGGEGCFTSAKGRATRSRPKPCNLNLGKALAPPTRIFS